MQIIYILPFLAGVATRTAGTRIHHSTPPTYFDRDFEIRNDYEKMVDKLYSTNADIIVGTKSGGRLTVPSTTNTSGVLVVILAHDLIVQNVGAAVKTQLWVFAPTCIEKAYTPTSGEVYIKGPFAAETEEISNLKIRKKLPIGSKKVYPTAKCNLLYAHYDPLQRIKICTRNQKLPVSRLAEWIVVKEVAGSPLGPRKTGGHCAGSDKLDNLDKSKIRVTTLARQFENTALAFLRPLFEHGADVYHTCRKFQTTTVRNSYSPWGQIILIQSAPKLSESTSSQQGIKNSCSNARLCVLVNKFAASGGNSNSYAPIPISFAPFSAERRIMIVRRQSDTTELLNVLGSQQFDFGEGNSKLLTASIEYSV